MLTSDQQLLAKRYNAHTASQQVWAKSDLPWPLSVHGTGSEDFVHLVYVRQEATGLEPDGKLGPMTAAAWGIPSRDDDVLPEIEEIEEEAPAMPGKLKVLSVPADHAPGGKGYTIFSLREDCVDAYLAVLNEVHEKGGIITSSGSKRSLSSDVSTGRSPKSMHYTALACDLYIYSGMVSSEDDPYVCVHDPDRGRGFIVYARAVHGEEMTLDAVTYEEREEGKEVTGKFINLTEIFRKNGFEPIRAKSSFFSGGSRKTAEWWHFQYEKALIPGVTTFGDALLSLYDYDEVKDSPPWEYKDCVWQEDWF